MKTIALLVTIAALTGCVSEHDRYARNCQRYGFAPGTDAFAGCMQRERAMAYDALDRSMGDLQHNIDRYQDAYRPTPRY